MKYIKFKFKFKFKFEMGCQPWGGTHSFPNRGPECLGTAGPMAASALSDAEFRRSPGFPPAQYPVCPPNTAKTPLLKEPLHCQARLRGL